LFNSRDIPYTDEKKAAIIRCIQYGVGDGIIEATAGYVTDNGRIGTIWDLINKELFNKLIILDCMVGKTKRGANWKIMSVFDVKSGYICHVVREERLKSLFSSWKRGNEIYHYLRCSSYIFNNGQKPKFEQGTIFDSNPSEFEINNITKTTDQIINDLKINESDVKGHFIVPFKHKGGIFKVRAIGLNEKMEIIADECWNHLINVNDSISVELASDYSDAANNPSRNLELTDKALRRTKRDLITDTPTEEKNNIS